MTNPILILNQPQVFVGLIPSGGVVYTIPTTGQYNITCGITFPAPSPNLAVTVTQNGSTVYTMPAPSSVQQIAQQFKFDFQAATNDAIEVNVRDTSDTADTGLQAVKFTIAIGQGF